MHYFDMHAHPTLKAALTNNPHEFNAWSAFPFYANGLRSIFLNSFREIVESQANLEQMKKAGTIAVIGLIGLEKAFAGNWAIQKILASPKVSPLSRELLLDVVNDRISYYELFKTDLDVLLNGPRQNEVNILRSFNDLDMGKVNLVLSVEGAHSFQSVADDSGESAIRESIVQNFVTFKNDTNFRLLHLTLAHLSRQPACVHCFGVKITVLGLINVTRDENFQPDPAKAGISVLGEQLIREAYDYRVSKRVLIDIKHMSYLSRLQFYDLRKKNGWEGIPIVASHIGVTGTSFSDATHSGIERKKSGCDLVSWNRKEGLAETYFNPWTINLFDDDIIRVLESKGIMGISLDQRILGYQKKFFGEFMSPLEVDQLPFNLVMKGVKLEGFEEPLPLNEATEIETLQIEPLVVDEILNVDILLKDSENDVLGNDMIFDLDEEDAESTLTVKGGSGASHINYLANNILHIVRVGYQNSFDGTKGAINVIDHICIGSDLDGIVDSLNFPKTPGGGGIAKKDWVTIDEYGALGSEVVKSLDRCIASDEFLTSLKLDTASLVKKVFSENGHSFLKNNFI